MRIAGCNRFPSPDVQNPLEAPAVSEALDVGGDSGPVHEDLPILLENKTFN